MIVLFTIFRLTETLEKPNKVGSCIVVALAVSFSSLHEMILIHGAYFNQSLPRNLNSFTHGLNLQSY